jgi:hypothetical protein
MNIGAGDKGKIFWEEGMAALDIMVQFRVKHRAKVIGSISFSLQDIFIPRQDFRQWFTIFNTPYDDVFDGDIGLDEDRESPRILLGFEISDDLGEETQDNEEESGTLLENTTLRDLESNITQSMAVPNKKGITSMDLGPTFDKKDYDTDYNLKSVQIDDLVGREQSSFGDFNLIPNYTIEDEVSRVITVQGESFQTGQKINFQSEVEVMKSNSKANASIADSEASKPGSSKNMFMSHHKDKELGSNVLSLNSQASKQDWKKVDKKCPQEISVDNSRQNSIIEESVNLDSIVSEEVNVGYQSQASLQFAQKLDILTMENET